MFRIPHHYSFPSSDELDSLPIFFSIETVMLTGPDSGGQHAVSPMPAGEPAPGEILSRVRDAAWPPVCELRYTAPRWSQVLLRVRDAGQRPWLRPALPLARVLHAQASRREDPHIKERPRR